MVCRQDEPAVAGQVSREVRDAPVHCAQGLQPLGRPWPVDMADEIEVAEVGVSEPSSARWLTEGVEYSLADFVKGARRPIVAPRNAARVSPDSRKSSRMT